MRSAPLAAVGLLGWAAWLVLFPRFDSAARWGYELDRPTALQTARQAVGRFGFSLPEARIGVQAQSQDRDLYFLSKFPASPAARFAEPVTTTVMFKAQDDPGLSIRLGRSGRVLGFDKGRLSPGTSVTISSGGVVVDESDEDASGEQPGPEMALEEAEQLILQALAELAGEEASAFQAPGQEGDSKSPSADQTWKAPELGDAIATPEASFQIRRGELAQARLELGFAEPFRKEESDRDDSVGLLQVISTVALVLGILAGLVLYLVGSVDREIQHRPVFMTLLALLPLQAIFFLWGGGRDAVLLGGDALWETVLEACLFILFVLLPVLAVLRGVGAMLAARSQAARIVSADLFLKGSWLSRPVGRSIAWGVCLAGAAACAPYLAAVVIAGAEPSTVDAEILSAPWPSLAALDPLASGPLVWILFVFAFLAPLTSDYLKNRPRLCKAVLLAAGWLFLAGPTGMEVSAWGSLLSGALILLIAYSLYTRMDLLSVFIMAYAAQVAGKAYTLLVQPAASLQWHGALALAAIGLTGAAALCVARWGRAIDMQQEITHREAVAQRSLLQRRGERERLLAEFSVARKAQELMLPEKPPQIEGFELAAACHPAREVGGDLYDFVPLRGGAWGIAVADVSGKGVPAALYMTLTKGLLRSVCEMSSRPDEIVRSMNVHLHECARRKVFVTLALAVLDPSSAKALCVRAGHNPPVWRQSSNGQARYLYSSGIGLGLAGARLFDRSLAVQEVQMAPGDSLILYSDGITEAMDADGQEYGDDRFREAIGRLDGMGALQARDLLLDDVRNFTAEVPQYDDMTLVVLKRE